jgi:hypothetical protein
MSFARELLVAVIGAATVLVGMPTIFAAPPASGFSRTQHREVAQTDREGTSATDESEREAESHEEGSAHDQLWLAHPTDSRASSSLDRIGLTRVDRGRHSARLRLHTHAIRGPPARG